LKTLGYPGQDLLKLKNADPHMSVHIAMRNFTHLMPKRRTKGLSMRRFVVFINVEVVILRRKKIGFIKIISKYVQGVNYDLMVRSSDFNFTRPTWYIYWKLTVTLLAV
jgi:hypothetical protein